MNTWSWKNVVNNIAWDDFVAGALFGAIFTCGFVTVLIILQ